MATPRARTGTPSWLAALPDASVVAGAPGEVSDVCYDSRQVEPGALFVAVVGFDTDGHRYLGDAIDRGAKALLVQADHGLLWEPFASNSGVAIVAVPDTRKALAQAAAGLHDYPARKLGAVGVTGTDGKTTTVHLIAHVLATAGRPSGYLSSASFQTGDDVEINASHMTTLEAPEVQSRLGAMVDAGKRYAVIEASSHGLALHRVDECHFDVGVFTTLSSDHLDFHGTLEDYRDAKGRLFRMLDESPAKDGVPKAAVLNADDPVSKYYRSLTSAPAIKYGIDAPADVRAESIVADGLSSRFRLVTRNGATDVLAPLAGRFNIYNCLAGAAVALSQGATLDEIAQGLETFAGVPGHLQQIDAGQGFRVVVDIASTPEALRKVLDVLRASTSGKLWAVFGAAGERDPGRRGGMGRVAGELVDFVVLTNEDPRREDPNAIIEEIAAALRGRGRREGEDFARVPDRREALQYAFDHARPGDTVLLAGKGTEQSIVIGTEHFAWDEALVAKELLEELMRA